ncbi:hypothetical protein ACQKQD_33180 [Methylobacterium sp. NPDC080182]|uniref:hypothetical protein n=1 Tax=Methylobacterium sp. NPDC080182 TaxID=3390590 RepID=UPI003D030AC2
MGDVLQFTPRPKLVAPEALPPLAGAELRTSLEKAAQTALDAADRIIAVLDRMDGDGTPATAAVVELPQAIPTIAPADILEKSAEAEAPSAVIHVPSMRWGGQGNVIAAAGTALLDLVGVR